MSAVAQETHDALAGISAGRADVLEEVLALRQAQLESSGLDERTFALVQIAALIALDAPPASYAWQVVSAEDVLGVLRAVALQVGGPRVIAAAPEIMLALGLSLPEPPE